MLEKLAGDINKKYNFKLKVYDFADTIEVNSGVEEWLIKCYPEHVSLYHKNKKRNKKREHLQKNVHNLKTAFETIYNHKTWLLNRFYSGKNCIER